MPILANLRTTISRLWGWVFVAMFLTLVIAYVAPQQLTVTIYKASLVCLAAIVGFALDLSLFPYARPDGYLDDNWVEAVRDREGESVECEADFPIVTGYRGVFAAAMLRRAFIVGLVILGFSLGL